MRTVRTASRATAAALDDRLSTVSRVNDFAFDIAAVCVSFVDPLAASAAAVVACTTVAEIRKSVTGKFTIASSVQPAKISKDGSWLPTEWLLTFDGTANKLIAATWILNIRRSTNPFAIVSFATTATANKLAPGVQQRTVQTSRSRLASASKTTIETVVAAIALRNTSGWPTAPAERSN